MQLILKVTIYKVKNERVVWKTPFIFTFGGEEYDDLRQNCKNL